MKRAPKPEVRCLFCNRLVDAAHGPDCWVPVFTGPSYPVWVPTAVFARSTVPVETTWRAGQKVLSSGA